MYSIEHSPAHGVRRPARGAHVLLHADGRDRRFQRMSGKNVLYPAGLGRQWPAHRAPRTELLRCALRALAARTWRATACREARQNQRDWDVVSRQNFIELREELAVEDEKVFSTCFPRWACPWTGTAPTAPSTRTPARSHSSRSSRTTRPATPTRPRHPPCGRHVPHRGGPGRAGGPEREGAYHRVSFHRPDGEKVFIETTRPELLPACVARWPTGRRALPAPFRHHRALPTVRRGGGGACPRPGEAGQGLGHRHDLHVRRPHGRDVVVW
ncbi:hypothetical protein QJS66_01570 [Kocuria rhizophila]|nr:hypothetical protein QJS66_01570 [Kocuria rhizophila]